MHPRCARVVILVAGSVASVVVPAATQSEPLFQAVHFSGPAGCESLAAGDLDGDGDVDLVAGGASLAQVLLNSGHRVFVPAGDWGGGGTDVSLGDLNGDGVLDLVVTSSSGPAVRLRLGVGDGTFGAATSYALSYVPAEAEIADLDLDGDLDLVVVQQDGRVKILLNDGAAAFSFALDVGPAGPGTKRIAVADLDGDGLPDLAVSATNGDVRLFLGLGGGAFEPAGTIASTFVPNDLQAGDLDLDGDLDLAVIDETAGDDRLLVYANDGNASFSGPVYEAPLPFLPRYVVLADLDEDGLLDALVSQSGGGTSAIHVFRGMGTLAFAPAPGVGATAPREIVVTDLDADGDLDLGLAQGLIGQVAVAWGEGDATFRKGPALAGSGQKPVVDDMNGDGRPDLVAATYAGVSVALNVGNGHLPDVLEQPSADFQYGVATGDVDGDGDQDVVSASWSITLGPGASLWLNDGTGQLSPPTPLPVPPRMQDVAAADLDGDGDVDFVFAPNSGGPSPAQGTVQVLLGLGNGSFLPAVAYAAPGAMQALAIADFDTDGVPDVVVSSLFGNRLHVLLGAGDGTLGTAISGPFGDIANDLVATDFDGDGRTDVAYTRTTSVPVLGVKLGNGDGTFGPLTSYGELANYGHLAAGDIDHDGVVDLVVGQSGLSIFHGAGDGSFTFVEGVAGAVASTRIVVADLDSDGWNDLAGTKGSDFSAEAWVLLNQHGPWNDLGHPLAGTAGLPRQTGEGPLTGGTPFRFELRDAKPLTQAFHIVGISTLYAPLKGGVLVPAVNFINAFPHTNAQGELALIGHWIAFPSGFTLYFQFWLPDPAGPAGFAASNAISATMP
jgi:hypothetical protein